MTGPSIPLGSINQLVREAIEKAASERRGFGVPQHGQRMGTANAVYAQVKLAGAGDYDVPHTLGEVPTGIELWTLDSPRGASPEPHILAKGIRVSEWTSTNCRVNIHVVVGSAAGSIAVFVVKGG